MITNYVDGNENRFRYPTIVTSNQLLLHLHSIQLIRKTKKKKKLIRKMILVLHHSPKFEEADKIYSPHKIFISLSLADHIR